MSATVREHLLPEIETLRATVALLEQQLAERDQHESSWKQGQRRDLAVTGQSQAIPEVNGNSTAVKRSEQVLLESERRLSDQNAELKQIYNNAPIGMSLIDRNLRFVRINRRLAEMNGLPPEDHLGKTIRDIIPQLASTLEPLYRGIFETGQPIVDLEVHGRTSAQPGVDRHWIANYFPILAEDGTVQFVNAMVQDVTQRKVAEKELRSSQTDLECRVKQRTTELARSEQLMREQSQMLRSIIDSMTDGVAVADREGRFLVFNKAGEKILGLGAVSEPPAEWPERYGLFLLDGSTPFPAERLPLVRAMKGETVREEELLVRLPNQVDSIFLSVNASPLVDDSGRLDGGVAVFRDITDSKRAQSALAESEERFRQLAENIRTVFWLGDVGNEQGKNLYVSPAYAEIWGRSVESLQASPSSWSDAIHPEDRQRVLEATTNENTGRYKVEYRILRPNGEIRWIYDRAFPIRDASGQVRRIAGIAEDITARKQFEQRLESEERLLRKLLELQEQERQLVASEIHDGFVQLVVGGQMRLEAGVDKLSPTDETLRENLFTTSILLQRAISEARRMISDLRPLILDEDGLVSAIQHLAADEHFCGDLQVEFSHDLKHKRFDFILEGCLFRIVQEALNNVKRHSGSPGACVRLVEENNRLRVEVQDFGTGFDPDKVSPERFGLQSIRERARLFGGSAEISSSQGTGTRVRVIVPISLGTEG